MNELLSLVNLYYYTLLESERMFDTGAAIVQIKFKDTTIEYRFNSVEAYPWNEPYIVWACKFN